MDETHLLLQSMTLGISAVLIVPVLLREKPRAWRVWLVLVFLWFFCLNMYFLPARMSMVESILRSVGVATIPFIGGWLFVRLTRKHFDEK